MSVPERIAMCAHPGGEHLHVALKPDEMLPTTCFQECDCTPVEFVRVTWIDGEAYTPLTSRERAFQEATGQARVEAERLRDGLRGLWDALDALEMRVRGDEVVAINSIGPARAVAEAMHIAKCLLDGALPSPRTDQPKEAI